MSYLISGLISASCVVFGAMLSTVILVVREKKNSKIQRIKLLNILSEELKIAIQYYEIKKTYYTRNSFMCNEIINNPIFNMNQHSELLTKVWELLRSYEALNTAIDSVPSMFNPLHIKIINKNTNLIGSINNLIHNNIPFNRDLDAMNAKIKEVIEDSTILVYDSAKLLNSEVEKQLSRIKYKHSFLLMF